MTLSDNQALFANDVARLLAYIFNQGYTCSLGEAYRTPEQAAIYAKEGKGIKESLHCKRLAIDLNLFKDGVYLTDSKSHEQFGKYWQAMDTNNRWGGKFPKPDGNHYERNTP